MHTRISLSHGPLAKSVLDARLKRLGQRWRECCCVAVLIAGALGATVFFGPKNEFRELTDFAVAIVGVLTFLSVCTMHVLVLNHLDRLGLLPATESQLELVGMARAEPEVARYLDAVASQGRPLNRLEAAEIIVKGRHHLRACMTHSSDRP